MTIERLQKFLSRAGISSRRQAEELILAGKVAVNGQVVTELGVKIDPDRDRVQVEGKRVGLPPPPVTFMLHKPYGCVSTTRDPEGRRTVMDLAPRDYGRLYPVGRLDYDATGLMLLTNDGELAQRLTHPRYEVPRTYRVTTVGELADKSLAQLGGGMELDGRPVSTDVRLLKKGSGKTIFEITVWEGRYHLIKRLLEGVGSTVLKLKRVAFGPLRLGRLVRGAWRPLTLQEQANLQLTVGHKYLKTKTLAGTQAPSPGTGRRPAPALETGRKPAPSTGAPGRRRVKIMPPPEKKAETAKKRRRSRYEEHEDPEA
jgi:23S rRNA pseudouridine2605 synthase